MKFFVGNGNSDVRMKRLKRSRACDRITCSVCKRELVIPSACVDIIKDVNCHFRLNGDFH